MLEHLGSHTSMVQAPKSSIDSTNQVATAHLQVSCPFALAKKVAVKKFVSEINGYVEMGVVGMGVMSYTTTLLQAEHRT